MHDNIAIKVEHISKTFKLPHERVSSIKSAVINFYHRKRTYELQEVLKNITFEVKKGEFLGIVGRNGSGKSTLLKLLAGIYTPTEGQIHVNGKITPFIELGVGFNPELTGRENVYLNGALLGFNRKMMGEMYDDIVAFAELERFMDQKLKNYSSGMQVRLAFSIAIRANSDILILDEVLAVGDAAFQRKCFDYFMQLKGRKKTVILVTHDMGAIRQYCDRAIMIEKGKLVNVGKPEEVAQAYQRLFVEENSEQNSNSPPDIKSKDRWGNGNVIVKHAETNVGKKEVTISCTYEAKKTVPPPVFGFSVYNLAGVNIFESNSLKYKSSSQSMRKGDRINYVWTFPNIFSPGEYEVSIACCDQSTTLFYDWFNRATRFIITKEFSTSGLTEPEVQVKEVFERKGGNVKNPHRS